MPWAKPRFHKRRLRAPSRRRFRLPLPFTLEVTYRGLVDYDVEKLLKKVSRGVFEGSGYAFFDDTRDVTFGFKRRGSAVAAAKRLKKLRRGLKVTVTGRIWP